MSNVKIELVDVTPAMATKWLEHNRNNRNVRDQHVETLARDMRSGNWKFNGDAVRFDENGNLADGQHRLWAIMHSGTTQQMLVVRGISEDAFETIDSGAPRNAADALRHKGFHNGPHVAATVRILRWFDRGRLEWNVQRRMSHTEIIQYAMEREGLQMAIDRVKYSPQLKRIAGAPLCAVTYLGYQQYPDLIEQFLMGVEAGDGIDEKDARHTFRDWLTTRVQNAVRYQTPTEFAITARAFNYFAAGRPVELFKLDSKNEVPELIPPGPKPPGPVVTVPKNSVIEKAAQKANGKHRPGVGQLRMAR